MSRNRASTADVAVEEQHEFLDAVKNKNWARAACLLHQLPRLIDVEPSGRWTALHQAAYNGSEDAMELFLEFGANPEQPNRDGQTALQIATSRFETLGRGLEPMATATGWKVQKWEREEQLAHMRTMLEDQGEGVVKRADALAHSYMVHMSSGHLSDEAIKELRNQWRLLDPRFSLLNDVVDKINAEYDKLRDEFFKTFAWSSNVLMLLGFDRFGWTNLAEFISWPFDISEDDVKHSVNILHVPRSQDRIGDDAPWVLPYLDLPLSDLLAELLPIWDGGDIRWSFQLMSLKRWFRKRASGTQSEVPLSRRLSEQVGMMKRSKTLKGQAERSTTLYLTILACKLASCFDMWLIWTLIETIAVHVGIYDFGWSSWSMGHPRKAALFWFGLIWWLTYALDAFKRAMQPRIPMLTIRLHRSLLQKGELWRSDFEQWSEAPQIAGV